MATTAMAELSYVISMQQSYIKILLSRIAMTINEKTSYNNFPKVFFPMLLIYYLYCQQYILCPLL